ncbi:uncharacterized protein LOC141714479 [Apium graveolens]|uniref:uncharacterized protein LOC141714479 n=1 Tax=Apium graveolens TaxID=4045 RepID=UPI003D7B76AF
MQQNFQDALAVCRYIGHPDIFLTMTTTPVWDEIQQMMKLHPGCLAVDSPDIIARVFKLKVDQIVEDIKKKQYFRVCISIMYVVEFQKRGLPHIHMLIWLDSDSKRKLNDNIDSFVSAEIPDPVKNPVGYGAVKSFMIHGPCGSRRKTSPCMKDSKYSKSFPKKYCPITFFDQSGFPVYKRRDTKITVVKNNHALDNQWVVPYNRDLLVKYQCHMNIEICCHARSLKYLFKYCLKGHDRVTIEVSTKNSGSNLDEDKPIDEIQSYFDGRLPFHLPGDKSCTFREDDDLQKVVECEKFMMSQLEAFFKLNIDDPNTRQYSYDEIPQHYVWNDSDHVWTLRKRGKKIGRLMYTHHSSGEIWYLRLLLTKIKGPKSFNALKKVDGVVYPTFKEACMKLGLLDDDNEWIELIEECSKSGFPPQIRELFVHNIVNCQVTDLKNLWEKHWKHMVDDFVLQRRSEIGKPNVDLSDQQLQYYALKG